jgi:hypothetical protein
MATTRVFLREKQNDATDDSDLASNGPQPFFPHPCTEDQPLATFFWDIRVAMQGRCGNVTSSAESSFIIP